MSLLNNKHSLIGRTIKVGANTLMSRIFGLTREIFLMRLLGIGIMADAFTTAFMLPNSLRKIFAEGALTSAFVPTFIDSFKKEGKDSANALMTLSFLVFESVLLVICALVMYYARATILFIAPGYTDAQVTATIPMLHIMMPMIFFISSAALLAGALNSVYHFFVPTFAPTLINIFFLGGIAGCLYHGYPISFLCWTIMAGAFIQFVMHLIAYFKYGFSFEKWNSDTITSFKSIITKFLFCFMSSSVMEVGLFIDLQFASYLPAGTVTLMKYSHRFMGIPFGVFTLAFSTILLPYFSRTKIENPEKLEYYLQEALKLVLWVTIPATIILAFFSDKVFLTLFASSSSKFPIERIAEAGSILAAFMSGLIFFSLNKIITTLFFALHNAKIPTMVTTLATLLNIVLNYFLVGLYGAQGIAYATSLCALFQTILFLYFLKKQYNYSVNYIRLSIFIIQYSAITSVLLAIFYFIYIHVFNYLSTHVHPFFISSFGFWLWVGPMILGVYGILFMLKDKLSEKVNLLN